MALQSDHQPTGAGDDEAAARNYLSRKKPKGSPTMTSSSDFESRRPTTIATVCNCKLSPSETTRITQQFNHSLIARIVGKDIRPGQLASRLRHHLRLTEDVKVFELGLGYFVLKFSETDYLALEDLPWSIANLCIYAFPWTPDFKPSEAINSSINVWIRLPELSIEYYDVEILKRIADAIGGCLVKIDPVTRDRWKCKFARFCIRVNLCDPLPSMIELGRIRQKIEYEGFELCPKCSRVGDLRHDCSGLSNPSGSSGFNPHGDKPHHPRTRSFKEFGSSSSSKQPLIPSESSAASAWESRFIEKDPQLDLKLIDWPKLPMGESGKVGTSVRISSPHVHVTDKAIAKQKEKCGISVQPLPNLPKQSSTITIKAPELKHIVPSVVEDPSKAAKTSNPTMIASHKSQPPSPTASIPSLRPCPASEATLKFHSDAIQCLTRKKEITNTLSKETNVDSCPTVYTLEPKKVTSLNIALSEVQTTSMSNQNQYTIEIVPTMRGGDEDGVGSEVASGSESCAKKMLCWKVHGTDNAKLMRALKDLIQLHEPSVVLIFGTKINGVDADQVVRELAFYGFYCSKPDGYNGGVWLLLSKQDVQTKVNSYNPQQVSASVSFHSETNVPALKDETSSGPWGSTFFYTSTNWMTSLAY